MGSTSSDVVVVIPGIMGSALRDAQTSRLVWGLENPLWYLKAWTLPDGLRALRLSDDEREGRYGRLQPAGLLRFPAWAPRLAGFEPYTRLVREIRNTVSDPEDVLEFAYDWRLPVEYNARLLAEASQRHLAERREARRSARREGRPPQLIMVAHSMGGLLVQALALIPGATDDIRTTITLGTPFYGSVKAAVILNSGRGGPVPLPRRRLRSLAATLPGLHDLLPTYRCLDNGSDIVNLTPGEVQALGGDRYLAEQSADFYKRLNRAQLVGHHSLVGVRQKTAQSLRLVNGVVEPLYEAYTEVGGALVRKDVGGDGTVYRDSAAMVEGFHEVVQQHGALPSTPEAVSLVRELVTAPGGRPRPLLGAGGLGMDAPDLVAPGEEFAVAVTDIACVCSVYELSGTRPTAPLEVLVPRWEDGEPHVRLRLPRPGVYRIAAAAGGLSAVSQLVMAAG
jgi:pimeloyl-ACP methyl ester carboxylesterase